MNNSERVESGYNCWSSMIQRCKNPNRTHYEYYGGRGISVCERWEKSFDAFCIDMGPRPSAEHSIDRIDPNGNYEPSNCRWATREEQHSNRIIRKKRKTKCKKCGQVNPPIQKGRCEKCRAFFRRTGTERPSDYEDSRNKPVEMVCVVTGSVIGRFKNGSSAIKLYGTGVYDVLKGRHKTAGGHKWRYANTK